MDLFFHGKTGKGKPSAEDSGEAGGEKLLAARPRLDPCKICAFWRVLQLSCSCGGGGCKSGATKQQLSPRGAGLLELCLREALQLALDSRQRCIATTPRLLYPGSSPPKVLLVLLMSPPPYCLPSSLPCCLSCPPPPSLDPLHSGCSSTDAARLLARLA